MIISIKWLYVCIVLLATLIFTGCTHTSTIPDAALRNQGPEFVVDKKFDFAVNLCLTDELRESKWERHSRGVTWVMPIGNQLAKKASDLSDSLFKTVLVTNTPLPAEKTQVDAILTPRVVSIERSVGTTVSSESLLAVVLEWKLEDRHGNIIWLDSIKGESRGKADTTGFTQANNADQRDEDLLKDLFAQSLHAIRTSPEISQFETKNRNKGGTIN